MALYDNYFTNEDKPFAENLNDAVLISNVFDFTVPIVLPTMFSNNTWVDTTSPRKCGVAIATLKEALPSGISVGTSSGNSTLTGTGTVKLLFYPNFNTFGKFKAINWTSNNNKIQVNLKKKNGTSIASNISKGNLSVNITDLEELLIEIVFTASDTLTSFTITMENKDSSNRYGADVKIQSVDGLETRLTNIESKNTSQDTAINGKVDKVTNKGLSSNDFTTAYKNKIDGLSTVATSGSYNDLTNKPSIPTKTSQLTNDGDGTNVFVKNNDSRLTNSRTPTSHTHGNLTNAGAIGSASGKIITTTTNGVLTASSTITKSKISDFPTTMAPTSHTHGNISNDGKIGSASGKLIVTGNNGVLSAVDNIDKSKVNNFSKEVVDIVYPVGSIYMSVNSTSPSILFGGTWEQLKDKFLLASGDTYPAGNTGGEATHTLTTNEMPSHTHTQNSHTHTTNNHYHMPSSLTDYFVTSEESSANNTRVNYNASGNRLVDGQLDTSGSTFHHRMTTSSEGVLVNSRTATNQNTGGGQSHNNMPPYLAVYMWKRTA